MTAPDLANLKISLLDAEEDRRQAMLGSNVQKLDMLLSSSMTYTHSSGITDSKPAYLQLLSSKTVIYKNIELNGLKVTLIGSVGLITGTMKATLKRDGMDKQIAAQYLAVWEYADGQWLLHAVQATSLPAAN